ncbi:MAG: hypothetical protein V7724_06640 [Sediminicola sp.]
MYVTTSNLGKLMAGLLVLVLSATSCSKDNLESVVDNGTPPPDPTPEVLEVSPIPSYPQRAGDPVAGKEYLYSGDYMSSGIPYNAYVLANGEDLSNDLERTGDNAVIGYNYTAVTAPNGVRIVAPNCLNCHSAKINGEYMVGLGSHDGDFTMNRASLEPALSAAISYLYNGQESEEWQAYEQFRKSIVAIGPKTITKSRGVNTANKITEVLISHRNKDNLEWSDTPYVAVGEEVIPADVPAWWLLKKKNALFYTAIGRNDFCKSFIGASLLTLTDVEKAREVDQRMPDVLAYIKSLEAPEYPFSIDGELADNGKVVFGNHCATCHGTYGDTPSYPNYLVSLKTVKTDPELSNHYTENTPLNSYFLDWFNNGYFGSGTDAINILPEGGYIAPPLDGVWATAPYFHNASVPTLMDVLNSKNRPALWSRTFVNTDYDQMKLGWKYTVESGKKDKNTYDTGLRGYGNGGHTFGDVLTDTERLALLEYLKTL